MAFVFLGGKILYMISQKPQSLIEAIYNILYGGFVFYGGLIGGCIGLIIYCKGENKQIWEYMDLILSIVPLGQAIGRIGCFFNGCCYGRMYDGILAVPYLVDGIVRYVFPTWFFESAFTLLLFLYFHLIHRCSYEGQRTGIYMVSYSLFRFFIEFFRGDVARGMWNGLSTSQWISLIVVVVGMLILYYSRKQRRSYHEF